MAKDIEDELKEMHAEQKAVKKLAEQTKKISAGSAKLAKLSKMAKDLKSELTDEDDD